jgi:nucleotide-binding universal stress UspA family protein
MKILLAVDGSSYTKKMLAYLVTHLEMMGSEAEFTAINVQLPLPLRAARAAGKEMVDRFHEDAFTATMAPIQKFFGKHGLKLATKMVIGNPGDEIAALAKKGKFGLVVIGSHGHGSVKSLVLGSVAQRVLASCAVPVLIVR